MSIDINVTVTLKPTEELITLVQRILNSLMIQVPFTPHPNTPEEQPITYEEHLALTAKAEVKPDVKQETKAKKTKPELTEAVEEAKAIIKPVETVKPVEAVKPVTPGQPDYSNITKDDIRALATEMQAHQGFNIKSFLKELGYPNISSIPAELYPEVYDKLKKEEVSF